MQMTGHLSEISWFDLLRFLDLSQQQGCLTIQCPYERGRLTKCHNYHFWISQGDFVGFSQKLDNRCLLSLVHQHGKLSYKTLERLANTLPQDMPLGSYLKQQGVLTLQQLHWLFHDQLLSPIQKVTSLQQGTFSFETRQILPQMEMTGLKLPIYEVQKCLTLKAS